MSTSNICNFFSNRLNNCAPKIFFFSQKNIFPFSPLSKFTGNYLWLLNLVNSKQNAVFSLFFHFVIPPPKKKIFRRFCKFFGGEFFYRAPKELCAHFFISFDRSIFFAGKECVYKVNDNFPLPPGHVPPSFLSYLI